MPDESGQMPERPDASPDLEAADIVASMGDATLLRGAAAVLLGFAVMTLGSVPVVRVILSIMDIGPGEAADPSYLAVNLGSKLLLAVLAGVLVAKAAPRAPVLHAGVLAAALTLFGVASVAGLRAGGGLEGPTWYPTALTFVAPAGVLIGALLVGGRKRSRAGPRAL